jgi:hypothetical protein
LEELRLTFGKGISVTFSGDKRPFLSFINTVEQFESYPRFRIVIGTIPDHFKNINARGSNLLEDQEITLIHELLHIFHHWATGQDLGFLREAFGLEREEYERLTDGEAFKIVRQDNNLFVQIVLGLTTNPKCSWKYEVTDTPFYHFHRDLILSRLTSQEGRLKFGDLAQIKLLDLLRKMQA